MSGAPSADRPAPDLTELTSVQSAEKPVQQREPISLRTKRLVNRFTGWVRRRNPNPDAALQEIAVFPLQGSEQSIEDQTNWSGLQIPLPPVEFIHRFPLYKDLSQEAKDRYDRLKDNFGKRVATAREISKTSGLSEENLQLIEREAGQYIAKQEDDPYQDTGVSLALYINRADIPPEIGIRFDAHGMTRGGMAGEIRNLNELLIHGIDPQRPFHTTRLRDYDDLELQSAAIGAIGPSATGGFIVIGPADQYIRDAGIAAVIVNEQFYSAIPRLQKAFPAASFIQADDLDKPGENGPLQGMIALS